MTWQVTRDDFEHKVYVRAPLDCNYGFYILKNSDLRLEISLTSIEDRNSALYFRFEPGAAHVALKQYLSENDSINHEETPWFIPQDVFDEDSGSKSFELTVQLSDLLDYEFSEVCHLLVHFRVPKNRLAAIRARAQFRNPSVIEKECMALLEDPELEAMLTAEDAKTLLDTLELEAKDEEKSLIDSIIFLNFAGLLARKNFEEHATRAYMLIFGNYDNRLFSHSDGQYLVKAITALRTFYQGDDLERKRSKMHDLLRMIARSQALYVSRVQRAYFDIIREYAGLKEPIYKPVTAEQADTRPDENQAFPLSGFCLELAERCYALTHQEIKTVAEPVKRAVGGDDASRPKSKDASTLVDSASTSQSLTTEAQNTVNTINGLILSETEPLLFSSPMEQTAAFDDKTRSKKFAFAR